MEEEAGGKAKGRPELIAAVLIAMAITVMTPVAAHADNPTDAADQMGAELAARLASAAPGDTVVVAPGYYRGNFELSAAITLVGEGRPVLDGGGTGSVLTVPTSAAGSVISGLRLVGTGIGPLGTPAGLSIKADDVIVENVEVADSYMGIHVNGGDRVQIRGNTVESYAQGGVEGELHATGDEVDLTGVDVGGGDDSRRLMRGDAITLLNAFDAVVEDNTIFNSRDGIYFSFAVNALVRGNTISDSRYGFHGMYSQNLLAVDNYLEGNLAGMILMYGGPFEVRGNTVLRSISPSTGVGIVLKDGAGATIVDNVIASNRVGIKLDNGGATATAAASTPAIITSNTIALNQVGIEIMAASRSAFSANSFVENTVQVVTDGKTPNIEWSVAATGYYWSSYKGYDSDGNGIGDVDFVEAGSIARTLVRSPVMISLASGPGFRLIQAIEDRWASNDPVIRDSYPLMDMRSPKVAEELRPEKAPIWLGIGGALAALASAFILYLARRPRTVLHV